MNNFLLWKNFSTMWYSVAILIACFLDATAYTERGLRQPREATGNATPSGCMLPELPPGRNLESLTCWNGPCEIVPRMRIPPKSYVTYNCSEGYTSRGLSVAICLMNKWSQALSCTRICPALVSDTINIRCTYESEDVSCEQKVFPGTRASLSCKNSYEIPQNNYSWYGEITCLENGTWDRPLYDCIAACGVITREETLAVGNQTASKDNFPWHVGIYEGDSKGQFNQMCGGTVVSPNNVISAAHCFYDETTGTLGNASRYRVLAGKYNRTYDLEEAHTQYSEVERIQIPHEYIGSGRSYTADIAVLHLVTPFVTTSFVKPICIDWSQWLNKEQLYSGQSGRVLGWGITEEGHPNSEVRAVELPYVNYTTCRDTVPEIFQSFLTPDKFCAGHLNGTHVCNGDSGGGLCFQFFGKWYIGGIVSIAPKAYGACDHKSYATFTDVLSHLAWIRGAVYGVSDLPEEEATSTSIGCFLPKPPNHGSFYLKSCERWCDVAEGMKVPIGSTLVYQCKTGYAVKRNNTSTCNNGTWSSPGTTCVKSCQALKSANVHFVCRHGDRFVSCKSNIATGTRASMKCKQFYKIQKHTNSRHRDITCLARGAWNYPILKCIPHCGKSVNPDDSLSSGTRSVNGEFPWHVGIYMENSIGKFEKICGGTLISRRHVISAAYCFWDETSLTLRNVQEFYVGAGKYYNISAPYSLDVFLQKSEVKRIVIAEGYRGATDSYTFDIALVQLKTDFILNEYVSPVCTDWDSAIQKEQLEIGYEGKMAVWKKSSEGVSTTEVRAINLPFVPYNTCTAALSEDLKDFATSDKFCAGHLNGSGICKSDIGSGLVFQYSGLWFLRGVASAASLGDEDCSNNHYTLFTNTQYFAYFRSQLI